MNGEDLDQKIMKRLANGGTTTVTKVEVNGAEIFVTIECSRAAVESGQAQRLALETAQRKNRSAKRDGQMKAEALGDDGYRCTFPFLTES